MFDEWFYDNSPTGFLAAAARRTEWSAKDILDAMQQMQNRMDRMSCFCWALWRILLDHTDLTEESLAALVQEIAAEAKPVREQRAKGQRCPLCKRPILRYKPTCAYCGGVVPEPTVFEMLF